MKVSEMKTRKELFKFLLECDVCPSYLEELDDVKIRQMANDIEDEIIIGERDYQYLKDVGHDMGDDY